MKTRQKPFKFDPGVKSQLLIGIMNVRNILSYGDTPMCQIWKANVKPKQSYGSDTNQHRQTGRQTDGQTDGRMDGRTE